MKSVDFRHLYTLISLLYGSCGAAMGWVSLKGEG